jgi:polar amino acid transport system substrate-binding protein
VGNESLPSGGTDPKNRIATDPADGHALAFKKLEKGRSDYLLDYKQPAEEIIKKEKLTGLKFSALKTLKLIFIVSKKAPDAENLLKKIDAAYLALQKEGAFK